jgi:hypothetical protein
MQTVPNRQCGECLACCKYMPIRSPELTKDANQLCPNYDFAIPGCKIYDTRPHLCRTWLCGWRVVPQIPDGWRPDQIGLLIRVDDQDNIPPAYAGKTAVKFMILTDAGKNFILSPDCLSFISDLVGLGLPVFINLPGPQGYFAAEIMINDRVAEGIRHRNSPQIQNDIKAALDILAQHKFVKHG